MKKIKVRLENNYGSVAELTIPVNDWNEAEEKAKEWAKAHERTIEGLSGKKMHISWKIVKKFEDCSK